MRCLYVRFPSARAVARIGAALLTTVRDLHGIGWVHGRIRPDHCIVGATGGITLCGFGAAHRATHGDHRFAVDLADAIDVIVDLAERLNRPARGRHRRAHRELVVTGPGFTETAGLEGAAVIATDAAISIATGLIKVGVFGIAGAVSAQVFAVAVLIGIAAFPGAFLAKALLNRMPLSVHTAILDAVVLLGGALMIAGAARA